jgi:hypothetical protein
LGIKYYPIDPEIMFSKSPFVEQNTEDFAFVKPRISDSFDLDPEKRFETFDLDDECLNSNMVIEVLGEGKQIFLRYFSSSLKAVINETYGELNVTDSSDVPLSQIYVKVFSKSTSGEVKFFRDGYTDIRGQFEYAQINSKSLQNISKFAILVISDDHGSVTKECSPPQNINKDDPLGQIIAKIW